MKPIASIAFKVHLPSRLYLSQRLERAPGGDVMGSLEQRLAAIREASAKQLTEAAQQVMHRVTAMPDTQRNRTPRADTSR